MPNAKNIEKHKWQKGQSGNPAGKKPGTRANKTILREYLGATITTKNPITGKQEEMTVQEAMNIAIIGQALKGNVHAYNALNDRFEGKPNQKIELKDEDGVLTPQVSLIDYDKLDDDTLLKIMKARKTNEEEHAPTTKATNRAKKKSVTNKKK